MDDYNKTSGQPSGSPTSPSAAGTATRMQEEISQTAADVKEKLTDFGRRAADKIDSSRESAAGAIDQTASSLHSSGDKISVLAHSTADKLQATADYVRRTDLQAMGQDVQALVKRYPGWSLAAAAVLGFLVSRGVRSND